MATNEDLIAQINMPPAPKRKRWLGKLIVALLMLPSVLALIAAPFVYVRFSTDRAVDYADAEMQFKYGSTGGERESGFPYWIWQVLPTLCAEHLPGKGYQSLGMIFEPGRDMPVGTSKRRVTGMQRVFLNCAACHVSTVRETAGAKARVYSAMPANTFDIMAFERFFFNCAADGRFTHERIIPEIQKLGAKLDWLDRYLVYPVAVHLMRDRILQLRERFAFVLETPHPWGPGRVDTFNSAKVVFNFPMHKLAQEELDAPADFPSVWNQKARDGMQLHWDGNNTKVEERNKSAAFGTGTTPPTIDLERIKRVEDWLWTLPAPKYPYSIDQALAAQGAPIYQKHCAACHGPSGADFSSEYVGKVTPWDEIGTDRRRLDSYTWDLAVNQSTLYAGYPWRFANFRKTFGYANMPLDGVWLRAPYLHNGSVPTLRDLLEPSEKRPARFYRGYDVYDPKRVGFVTDVDQQDGRKLFLYDTNQAGNFNHGHEGMRYGTEMLNSDKDALVEFLKTF